MGKNAKTAILNVHSIMPHTRANGPGKRIAIWVQGCSIKCPGCYNTAAQEHAPSHLIPIDELVHWIMTVPDIDGITLSGGEPFEQASAVLALLKDISSIENAQGQSLSTFVFTGYSYNELKTSNIRDVSEALEYIDILCAGPFMETLHDPDLLWRGSSNQELIFLTDRYSPDMIPLWQESVPHEEVVITHGQIEYTGFGGPRGIWRGVIAGALIQK